MRKGLLITNLPPCHVTSADRSTESDGDEHETDGEPERRQYHFHARSSLYPGTAKKRFPVPEEKVPWEVPDLHFVTL